MASVQGSDQGLSAPQAQTRLIEYGKNRIQSANRPHLWRQFLQRFYNPLFLLLLFACVISAATGQIVSAAIIVLMVVFGAALDVLQKRLLCQCWISKAVVAKAGKWLIFKGRLCQ